MIYNVFLNIKASWSQLSKGVDPTRIAVILGSSNAGIEEGELAISQLHHSGFLPENYVYEQQEYGNPAQFLASLLGCTGPTYVISTACSSSAKAFISAARLLQAGVCDLALIGGSDVLSQLTVNGFMALEAVDGGRCQPFAQNRQGIHLGEAAALFILSRNPSSIKLAGWGESADAHHMSAPHPEGVGAEVSMRAALARANIPAKAIDYVNLHGTATAQNDAMESLAVARVFGEQVPVSSTKSLTGHTLGAAGAIEALLCCQTLAQTATPFKLPPHWIDDVLDPQLPALRFINNTDHETPRLHYILSNSFGFGGSNASLILKSVPMNAISMALPVQAEAFMPHSAPMALIDQIVECQSDRIVTQVKITPQSMFVRQNAVGTEGIVPSWVGIEYMAQSAAAWSGFNAHAQLSNDGKPPIGYLLGSRDYTVTCSSFSVGDVLTIYADCLLHSTEGMGSFDCRIERNAHTIATARLSVFQPKT